MAIADRSQGSYNFISLIDPNIDAKKGLDKDAGAEQVAPLQPDLVILKSYNAETLGAPLEALGIPVVYVDLETPEQYSRDLAIMGQIFGDEARAQELVAYYETKVAEISEKAAAAESKPRVLLLSYNDRDGNVAFNVMPMSWIQTQMVELAGGEPVWADANPGSGSAQVTLEQIAAWDPDQVYIVAYNNDPSEVVAGLQADPNWEGIRAVEERQLYAFPGDFYSWDQPDPRWILGLNWLATRIQPEIFADVDMTAVVMDFYDKVYGLDAAFVEENVLPAIWGDMP